MNSSFSDIIQKLFPSCEDHAIVCPTITLQVTEDCCLNCSYCYQINKSHKMMSKDVMKSAIDLLFKMYDEDNPQVLINKNTKGIILDFIGGEPFMNIDVMSYGVDYFIEQCIQKDHPWLPYFRISISSNGIFYFDPKVQEFLKKFRPLISLTITIDGPEEMHDNCRKDYDGNGSFTRSIAAFLDWNKNADVIPTKVTIAPENLNQLSSIINFFIDLGCNKIAANPIHEHIWTAEESKIYYNQLKIIADLLLEHLDVKITLFSETMGMPLSSRMNTNWCGGTGSMLAFDPDGIAYPCLRYMASSLGNEQPPIIIGDTQGIYKTKEQKKIIEDFNQITRRSQSSDECFNCHIASGCGWCSAWNYQQHGTVNKRSTNLCWMHRAKVLANTYYYNSLYRKTNNPKRLPVYLDRTTALKIISNEEYDQLLMLSS